MEISTSKAEIIKPLLLKAGIPLTLSLAAFVYAKILARRSISETRDDCLEPKSPFGSDHESFESLLSCDESFFSDTNSEEETFGLKRRIEELQKRQRDLETRFIRYHDMKEQESSLTRLRDAMLLEMARVEFLDREISLMQDGARKVENFVAEYIKVLESLEHAKSERGLLQRKVKTLSKRVKVQSNLVLEREAELLRAREMLEAKTNVVKKLEDELEELRSVLDCLREEKNELSNKLDLERESTSLLAKIEEKSRLENELDQLKKDRAAEAKELIYLRWTNACLRHDLTKIHEQQEQLDFQGNIELGNYSLAQELDGLILKQDENESRFGGKNGDDQGCSKRKKFVNRLRKWVEGCEKGKGKVGDEVKCFGRHSVSYEANEHVEGRWSCSSV